MVTVKSILFWIVMLLWLIPLFQHKFRYFEVEELHGAVDKIDKPSLTSTALFNGSFQKSYEKYLKANFGFRNTFIRINNQRHYSLYGRAFANGVVVGKQSYLYEENYIKAYLGLDFIGEKAIKNKIRRLAVIKDTLHKYDKEIVVLLAPGKASFYPEFIPGDYPKPKTKTNYKAYKKMLKELDILTLDFNDWFRKMKDTSTYPLFPKTGIHWSKYGEFLVADSLVSFFKTLSGKDLPALKLTALSTPDTVMGTDDDIEKGMNLLFNISDLKMAYPEFTYNENSKESLKVLTIADSYYWGLHGMGISNRVFGNGEFWYYNKQIYPDSFTEETLVQNIDLLARVMNHDAVLIICTDANLYKFAFGFIDALYDRLDKVGFEQMIEAKIEEIKNTPEWYENIQKQSQNKNEPIEVTLRKNAIFVLDQKPN